MGKDHFTLHISDPTSQGPTPKDPRTKMNFSRVRPAYRPPLHNVQVTEAKLEESMHYAECTPTYAQRTHQRAKTQPKKLNLLRLKCTPFIFAFS